MCSTALALGTNGAAGPGTAKPVRLGVLVAGQQPDSNSSNSGAVSAWSTGSLGGKSTSNSNEVINFSWIMDLFNLTHYGF